MDKIDRNNKLFDTTSDQKKAPYEAPCIEESAEFEAFCIPCAPFAPGECTFPQGNS
ncbi:MAG: hypothetical protein IPJ88_02795 [Myxococcales bacterium]|nr:MAG: hypothetical protein IPJ88_02795 [Myxococcales bacterium]